MIIVSFIKYQVKHLINFYVNFLLRFSIIDN
ncbi:uncharacterized protein METZ01_LOCUS281911 [marine metagenome]|uniref:Uncharacterized protein n=1 Tax=marine metagenome TaxID=408172 RepID=A0A382L263_9ZZZZ